MGHLENFKRVCEMSSLNRDSGH